MTVGTTSQPHGTLRDGVADAWPLLSSVLLLMTGAGLLGSLLGLRAELEGFSTATTGLVLALYYLGYVAGSAWVPGLIRSVGHIRVFTALASVAGAAVVVHGVWVHVAPWMVLRFATGVCIAGLFIVTESWLHAASTPRTRASILAVYNSLVTGGLAIGSVLLNVAEIDGVVLFVVGSVIVSIAAVPVALVPREAPALPEYRPISLAAIVEQVPVGMIGASLSGIGTGTALGFGAVYATRAGFDVAEVSQFMGAILVGGTLGQVPLGHWSDRTDRRLVMIVAAGLIGAGGVIGFTSTLADAALVPTLVAATLVGAGSFSLYGLSFAHVGDHVAPASMAGAGAHIIRVNGLSAASGPLVASVAVSTLGPEGFFAWLVIAPVPLVVLTLYRMTRRGPVDEGRRARYTPLPTSATQAVLDEAAAEMAAEIRDAGSRAGADQPRPFPS